MKFLKNKQILDIEEAKPKDAEAILQFLKQVGSESDNLTIDKEGVPLTLEQEIKYLEQNLLSTTSKSFAGKVDGKIVSLGGIQGSSRDRIKHNVDLGISVLKDYWNLGVATHMMNYIINYSRTLGEIKNIVLEVRSDNEFGIKLYKGLGFKDVGVFSNKFKIGDIYYDCCIMELMIKNS